MNRLPDAPILSVQSASIDALEYNVIHLALVRLGEPLVVNLGARDLDLILERDLWLCRDRRLDDRPLVAWLRFARQERAGPYDPVRCEAVFYHAYGQVVGRRALSEAARRLAAIVRLPAQRARAPVIAFPSR